MKKYFLLLFCLLIQKAFSQEYPEEKNVLKAYKIFKDCRENFIDRKLESYEIDKCIRDGKQAIADINFESENINKFVYAPAFYICKAEELMLKYYVLLDKPNKNEDEYNKILATLDSALFHIQWAKKTFPPSAPKSRDILDKKGIGDGSIASLETIIKTGISTTRSELEKFKKRNDKPIDTKVNLYSQKFIDSLIESNKILQGENLKKDSLITNLQKDKVITTPVKLNKEDKEKVKKIQANYLFNYNNEYRATYLAVIKHQLVQNQEKGSYYRIDFKKFTGDKSAIIKFDGGKYVIRNVADTFSYSITAFIQNVVKPFQNIGQPFHIFIIGSADVVTFSPKNLENGYLFTQIELLNLIVPQPLVFDDNIYSFTKSIYTVSGADNNTYTNEDLPNLRAMFIKDRLTSIFERLYPSTPQMTILNGRVKDSINNEDRNTTIILYIPDSY